jgi:replication-associated recombination protein RarA
VQLTAAGSKRVKRIAFTQSVKTMRASISQAFGLQARFLLMVTDGQDTFDCETDQDLLLVNPEVERLVVFPSTATNPGARAAKAAVSAAKAAAVPKTKAPATNAAVSAAKAAAPKTRMPKRAAENVEEGAKAAKKGAHSPAWAPNSEEEGDPISEEEGIIGDRIMEEEGDPIIEMGEEERPVESDEVVVPE